MTKNFLKALIILFMVSACKNANQSSENKEEKAEEKVEESNNESKDPFFKLSLAQWSLHKMIQSGEISPLDFAEKAKELGFEGLEYVSQLYTDKLKEGNDPKKAMDNLLDSLKQKSDAYGVKNLIIMIDGEGDLATTDEKERNQAVENHKKWVDAAQFLGCHSIRVNLFGTNDPEEWVNTSVDGLKKLSEYAATKNVNVLVENHGYLSSNAQLLVEVMEKVNMKNCGTLPDFGNFCLEREGGQRWGAPCVKEYDKYQGVKELMEYAKAVSAKSYAFDDQGYETTIDYKKMLDIVKNSGYDGFIGVEYEGSGSEIEGIKATRDLLLQAAN